MKNHCYITRKDGGVYIECSYDPDFIEVLKSHVPPSHRRWDEDLKRWWVSDEFRNQVERDCRIFFDNVIEC